MKVVSILVVLGVSVGLFGCASDKEYRGGTGNEVGTSEGEYHTPPPAPLQAPTGPNNSIGSGNPFGLGPNNVQQGAVIHP